MGRGKRPGKGGAITLTPTTEDESDIDDFAETPHPAIDVTTPHPSKAVSPRSLPPLPPSSSTTWVQQFAEMRMDKKARLISARKATDIERWLTAALDGTGPRFLLLGGPPGCGKSSALKSIAEQQNCSLVSWQAPACDNLSHSISATLLADLNSFIVGTRYSALVPEDDNEENNNNNERDPITMNSQQNNNNNRKRLLMIDDLPVTSHDAQRFRDELKQTIRHAAQFAPHPTVLVLSDSARGIARTSRMLLGVDFAMLKSVKCITVPPVTEAVMRKRLREVATRKKVSLSPAAIDNVILLSNGDFRAALNSLQFSACISDSKSSASAWLSKCHQPSNKKTKALSANAKKRQCKRARLGNANHGNTIPVVDLTVTEATMKTQSPPITTNTSTTIAGIGSDSTLGMYHAISKILNNKRDDNGDSKYDAEKIVTDSRADASAFIEFLHHNYPPFFGSADDIVPVLDHVSLADTLLPWSPDDIVRSVAHDCATSVVTRAFLHFNSDPVRSGWRPIHGPESRAVSDCSQQYASFAYNTTAPFCTSSVPTKRDSCDILPYLKGLRRTAVSPSQFMSWNSTSSDFMPGLADKAEVAMIDSEIVKTETETQKDTVPQQVEYATGEDMMGTQPAGGPEQGQDEDDIEEWDDD